MQQLQNVATLPWIKGLAVMPDVHYGKGATVGSVIAMRGAVCPAAVGVDIGCGMSAVKTSLTANDLPGDLSRLRSKIEQAVLRVGSGLHREAVEPKRLYQFPTALGDFLVADSVDHPRTPWSFRRERATQRMGTLSGGGNHFVEFCLDASGSVWLMLHSGSRNIGKELAEYHIGAEAAAQPGSHRPRPGGVRRGHPADAQFYRHDLFWAQEVREVQPRDHDGALPGGRPPGVPQGPGDLEPVISCHHNYVAEERYEGVDLLVTRKGAMANYGEFGIIPGSIWARARTS
ncbi:RtcB family protein [Streptomyces tanashiensis]